jgi:trigger factor
MKIELTDLSPVKKTLEIEADAEDVSKETEDVLRRYASQVRLPGFRQGKAPIGMIKKRFAKEIDDDVRERMISRLWREATREKGLMPLGDPVLEDLKHEEGCRSGSRRRSRCCLSSASKTTRGSRRGRSRAR